MNNPTKELTWEEKLDQKYGDNSIKVYLDTCILSNLQGENFKKPHMIKHYEALDKVADLDFIELVTSEKTLEEFLGTKDDGIRIALKVLFKLVSKVSTSHLRVEYSAGFGQGSFGMMPFNTSHFSDDPLFSVLKGLFDVADAEHIFHAAKAGCQYFLTVDDNTIIKRVNKNRNLLETQIPHLKIVDPTELLESLVDLSQ